MRLYKSGTGWCVWRWTITDSEYITRLHIFKTLLNAVCLHWINKPDREPCLHDHPVTFFSIILRGGYTEERIVNGVYSQRTHRWFNFIRASPLDQHRIIHVRPNTLTLVFMGPKKREWGFHTPSGWVHWKDYYTKQRAEKQGGGR